jgi:hypothetical protein
MEPVFMINNFNIDDSLTQTLWVDKQYWEIKKISPNLYQVSLKPVNRLIPYFKVSKDTYRYFHDIWYHL